MALVKKKGWALAVVTTLALLGAAACDGPVEVVDSLPAATRVENPFAGVKGYVNPEWRAHVLAESGGDRVANTPTAVWLRTIASISGVSGGTSLRQHLDNALAQGAGYVEVVLYNLPGCNCSSAWTSEIQPNDLATYETQFVDPIAEIEADSKYASLRIINILEPRSLAYAITSLSTSRCASAATGNDYVGGIQYALGKLGAIPNAYNYLDIAHHGVLGWETNMSAAVALYVKAIQGASGGFGTVAGFVSNVGNYSATVEPFFQATTKIGGTPVRQSRWVDWANYADEQSFAAGWKSAMVARGMSDKIGMIIDTSRNGWGGASRPTKASTSTEVNTFVNASRIDRRPSADSWCNQSGAGLGERPQAVDANGIQAYVWIKPPGESDGASPAVDDPDDAKGFDRSCDPSYLVNGTTPTGALPNAPISERWFSSEFQELMANAYPPLEPVAGTDTNPPSAPTGLAATSVTAITATLSWSASTDDVGVVAYDVYSGTMQIATEKGTTTTVANLRTGTTYSFTVRARDAAGNVSARSSAVTVSVGCACDTTPPTVPTGLTYTNLTYSSVTLRWAASADNVGVTGYEVLDGGVVIGTSETTRLDVSGLLPGTTHSFSVRALDAVVLRSSASTPVTVTIPTITVPSAPGNLRWAVSEGTVTLCWDAPDDWDGSGGYHLLFGSLNLGLFRDTCVALIGFKPGTPYTFTVKTVNAAGNASVASNSVTVLLGVPKDTTPPTAPTGLTASILSDSSVRLKWSPSTDNVGVVLYQIYLSGALLQTVAASTSATVTGLTAGQTYTLTVKAADAGLNLSSASNAVTVTLPAIDPSLPATPVNLTGHTIAAPSWVVSLSWDQLSGGAPVESYEVYLGDLLWMRTTLTSVLVVGKGSQTYTVRARDAAGNLSAPSAPFTIQLGDPGDLMPLPSPSQLQVTSVSGGSVSLAWTPGKAGNYGFVYIGDLLVGISQTSSITVSNLTVGKEYTFHVVEMDYSGAWGKTATNSVTVMAGTSTNPSPATPINLTGHTIAVPSWVVSLSWEQPTGGAAVESYEVYLGDLLWMRTTLTSVLVVGKGSQTYTVRARDAAGNLSAPSAPFTIQLDDPADPMPLAAPSQLAVTSVSGGTVVLAWTPGTAGNYGLVYAGDLLVGISQTGSAAISNLTQGKEYTFHVEEMSALGAWGKSATNSVTVTAGTMPGATATR